MVANCNFGPFKTMVNNCNFGQSKIMFNNRNFGRSKITFHNRTFGWFLNYSQQLLFFTAQLDAGLNLQIYVVHLNNQKKWFKMAVHNRDFGQSKITVHNRNFGQQPYFGQSKITFDNRTF